LRAQSVAARTYAIYKKVNARANGTVFDICATTSCQVYSGYGSASSPTATVSSHERSSTNAAIDATAGRVLLYNGQPILAEFSSSTGGHTAPGSVPYQKAVPDLGDAISPHHDWRAEITVAEVEARWPQIGRLTNIQITQRDGFGEWGGRVQRMRLDGTDGSIEISGGAWRSAFAWPGRTNGVRGTYFTVLLHAGAAVSVPEHVVVERGSQSYADIRVRNTGSGEWPIGGEIMVGTASPSALANDRWVSSTRAARVGRNVSRSGAASVGPGDIAEFRIPLTGGTATTLTERFSLFDGSNPMEPSFTLSVQYLDPWIEEAPNMLRSASFEDGIGPWLLSGMVRGDGTVAIAPRDGDRVLRITGGGVKRVTQRIALAGGRGRTFTFGGWNRAVKTSGSGGAIDLIGAIRYTDGSVTAVSVPFARVPHAWVYDERTFTSDPTKVVASVELIARSVRQTGTVYFDALRLVESPVPNASFEDGLRRWSRDGFVAGDGATAATGRDGSRSLILTGAAGVKSLTQSFDMIGRRTERVALSFWHQTQGLNPSGGEAAVRLTMRAPNGDEAAVTVDIPKADHPWTYSETIVSIPWAMSSADMTVSLRDQTGQLYVDAVRLSRTFTRDPSFEAGTGAWVPYGDEGVIAPEASRAREAASGAQLVGAPGRRGVYQRVALASGPGALFYLQGWSRSTDVASTGGLAGYVVVFRNTDGTTTNLAFPVATGTSGWTFLEKPVRSTKRFARIDLYVQLNDRSGVVAYDAIRLVRA
jgi:SpoIID/LytB domain protein